MILTSPIVPTIDIIISPVLTMYNVQSIPMLLPESKLLSTFEKQMELLNKSQNAFMKENQRLNQLKNLLLSKLTIE